MGDVTRVLVGLEDFEVAGAVETAAGGLEVSVRVARPDAAVSALWDVQLSGQGVSDLPECATAMSYERPTTLVWAKRRFRCDTPGCVGKLH